MSKKDVEAALARGVEILGELLPLKSWLYFPVLYSACVWAVRRVFDYRERVLAWQVWLDPEFIRTKPDEFVLHFFAGHEALSRAYADEIARRDVRALRAAFAALYPIFGLEDAPCPERGGSAVCLSLTGFVFSVSIKKMSSLKIQDQYPRQGKKEQGRE